MNKKIKIIAASALFTFALTIIPGLSIAKDSVRKWGYWEDLVSPAAGPQVAALPIASPIPGSSPEHIADPIPVDPVDPVPDPPKEVTVLFGYTKTKVIEGGEVEMGIAEMSPYFDEAGDPTSTEYESAYYEDTYGFTPTGTGGFSYNPFGSTAAGNGLAGYNTGDMPADFAYNDSTLTNALVAVGYKGLAEIPGGSFYPQNENGIFQLRELTDKDGDPTGIYEVIWSVAAVGQAEEATYFVEGYGYYGALAPLSYLNGPALSLPEATDIGALANTGDINYSGRIQGVYTGYTQSNMDVTVGIDFNASTFAATFGANQSAGFAASGTLNGQHLQSTVLSGINDTIMISGDVHATLHGIEATSMTGGIDVNKIVIGNRGPQAIAQIEAFAASTNGIAAHP